jgi:hypothetical protein
VHLANSPERGDCNDDILTMVGIALGTAEMPVCGIGNANEDGQITMDKVLNGGEQRAERVPRTAQ